MQRHIATKERMRRPHQSARRPSRIERQNLHATTGSKNENTTFGWPSPSLCDALFHGTRVVIKSRWRRTEYDILKSLAFNFLSCLHFKSVTGAHVCKDCFVPIFRFCNSSNSTISKFWRRQELFTETGAENSAPNDSTFGGRCTHGRRYAENR